MKALYRMSAVAAAATLTFGFGAAANAATVDCNDLTAEQKSELEYAKMGIIEVPADLQKCVMPEWDTPSSDEAAAAENDHLDAAEAEYNRLNAEQDWDTPTRDEAAAAENDYLDAAEAEYNRLNAEQGAEGDADDVSDDAVANGEEGTAAAETEDATEATAAEGEEDDDATEASTSAAPTNSGLARTGASIGILAALGAGVTAVGGGFSYLRKRA